SRHSRCICLRMRQRRLCRRRVGIVPVEERMEDRGAEIPRTALAETVEGYEESHILVEQQVHVAVECLDVTAMSDDAQTVAILLIEPEVEPIHPGRHP